MGLSGSQVCWTPPAAKASLILCLWGWKVWQGTRITWARAELGDPVATHVALIMTWDELIVDSSSLGAWREVWSFQPLGTCLFKGISSC